MADHGLSLSVEVMSSSGPPPDLCPIIVTPEPGPAVLEESTDPEKLLVLWKAAAYERTPALSSGGWLMRAYRAMRSKHVRAAQVEYLDPRYLAGGQVPVIGLNERGEVRITGDFRDGEVYQVLSDDEAPPYHNNT